VVRLLILCLAMREGGHGRKRRMNVSIYRSRLYNYAQYHQRGYNEFPLITEYIAPRPFF